MKDLFNQQFKFKINDSVRHKGDTKSISADMGLLILERHLMESEDQEGNAVFERAYVCRMIRFSGSGDLARFNERELMSIADHEKERIEREKESNDMRTELRMVEKEVMELFGISKEDYLYEVIDGKPNTDIKFRMSGFEGSGEDGVVMHVTESLITANNRKDDNGKVKRETRRWNSKDQFVKVNAQ